MFEPTRISTPESSAMVQTKGEGPGGTTPTARRHARGHLVAREHTCGMKRGKRSPDVGATTE